jgi:thymidylate kinase
MKKVLLSDRSVVIAYAIHFGLIPDWYLDLVEPGLIPDLAVFIDTSPEVAFERIRNRDSLLLDEDFEALKLFYENYGRVFNKRPSRLKDVVVEVIDGDRALEDVMSDVITIIEPWVNKYRDKNGRKR